MSFIAFRLPWPPTVNTYWRHIGSGPLAGRVLLSERGRTFRTDAQAAVLEQRVPRPAMPGRLAVRIDVHPPDRRARDLDNLPKGILDSLKHSGVIRDDADIDSLTIVRRPVVRGGVVLIRIEAFTG